MVRTTAPVLLLKTRLALPSLVTVNVGVTGSGSTGVGVGVGVTGSNTSSGNSTSSGTTTSGGTTSFMPESAGGTKSTGIGVLAGGVHPAGRSKVGRNGATDSTRVRAWVTLPLVSAWVK